MPAGAGRSPRGRPPRKALPDSADLDAEARILDAARRVFVRRGTSGARIQEIASEAGVTSALVHYYFRSKDALAERVFVEAAGELVRALTSVPDPNASFEVMLERFVHGYIDTVRRTPFLPAYLMAEAHQHPARLEALWKRVLGSVPASTASAVLGIIERKVALRVASGEMRAIPPHQLLTNIMALVVFPFVARPMLSLALGFDDAAFDNYLDERRRELPAFILNALRP